MKKYILFIGIVVVLISSLFVETSYLSEDTKETQILVIYAANPLLPAIEEFYTTLNDELIIEGFGAKNVHIEFIDRQYKKKPGFDEAFTEYIKNKYRTEEIDVVVSQGRESTIWLNQTDLFPNSNFVYVFSGGNKYENLDYNHNKGYYITGGSDAVKTIRDGLRLMGNTKQVVLIHGGLSNENRYNEEIIEYLENQAPEVKVSIANNETIEMLKKDLATYPEETLGFYISFFSDGQGTAHTPREVLSELYNEINFPLVGFYSSYLDHGILGGSMISLSHEAKRTADYIMKALAKDSFEEMIEVGPDPVSVYDMKVINAFEINENRIPSYAQIINEKPSIWEAYQEYVVGATLLIILLIGVVILSFVLYNKERVSKEVLEGMNTSLESLNAQLEEEIMEKELARKEVLRMALYDELTGLKNRNALKEDLELYIKEKNKLALVVIDLDDFKQINDIRGHDVGDDILKRLANFLSERFEFDAYRVGGDEFSIIIDKYLNTKDLRSILENMLLEIKNSLAIQYHLTASVGVVMMPDHSKTPIDLLKHGDIAMNEAKYMGKDQICFYHEKQSFAFYKKVQNEREVRDIIAKESYEFYYQPIVLHQNGTFDYFELLLRLKSDTLGTYQFITIAERIGMISQITDRALETAFSQIVAWENQGYPKCKISVNVSANDFKGKWLIEKLNIYLEKYDLEANQIELEITESIIVGNNANNINKLKEIRALGFTIALDDFGTGYSSLNYLTYMPIDKIKLDKTIKDRWLKESYEELIFHLVNLTKVLNLDIVIEGIEEKDEWQRLKDIPIDFIQGYLFDKPLISSEAVKYLTKE